MSRRLAIILTVTAMAVLAACTTRPAYDYVITGGDVFTGTTETVQAADIAVTDGRIQAVAAPGTLTGSAVRIVNAEGLIVAPGFIDPHTHRFDDLRSPKTNLNIPYLTQGVTTVLTGNDGGGPYTIADALGYFQNIGTGTNVGLFAGHKTIRTSVMGLEDRAPSQDELQQMKSLLRMAMEEGAFGFSTGLYYVPGSFADTEEIIELTRVLTDTGGVYESHLRDESSYSIGLIAAVEEAIEIGRVTAVPVHIAHIKALGVDVWGKSAEVISLVEDAHAEGLSVTADQYPWRASGTRISNALIPNWVKAGSTEQMMARLEDEALALRINTEISENLRIRGGADALLIVSGPHTGLTLEQVAIQLELNAVAAARRIVMEGDARVASFNMNPADIENFMHQPWVMTSSDGTRGHPRKYASYPRKFETYVQEQGVLSLPEYIYRSSALVAQTFGICERGQLKKGYWADIVVFDPAGFKANADFKNAEELTTGVEYLFVNGELAIDEGRITQVKSGRSLRRDECGVPGR